MNSAGWVVASALYLLGIIPMIWLYEEWGFVKLDKTRAAVIAAAWPAFIVIGFLFLLISKDGNNKTP